MRKIVSYAASLAFIFGAFFFLLTTPTLARDPGVAGDPDAGDVAAIQAYCQESYPSDPAKSAQCVSMLRVSISQGWSSLNDTVQNCSELPSKWFAECEKGAPDGIPIRDSVINDFQQDLSIFINRLPPYYNATGEPPVSVEDLTIDDVKLPFLDTNESNQAQTRLDASPITKQNILNQCKSNPDNQGQPASYVANCISCASIAYGFGLKDLESDTCNSQISQISNTAAGELTLGGSANGNMCVNMCGRYNERIGGISNAAEITETLEGKSVGVKSKFDIYGITCGVPNSPFSACCAPISAEISCVLDDLKIFDAPSGSSWLTLNPIKWGKNAAQTVGAGVQNGSIAVLCKVFEDSLKRRITKLDQSFFNNAEKFPELQSMKCVSDPARPGIRAVEENNASGEIASCTCVDESVELTTDNFGQGLCNRIAVGNEAACVKCVDIAVLAGMDCDSESLSEAEQATCSSCVSEPFYDTPANKTVFDNIASIGEKSRTMCESLPTKEYSDCVRCMLPTTGGIGGYWTGFGCIYTDPAGLVTKVLAPFGLGIAFGAAFLSILYSAYLIQTSQGNPEKLKRARQYLTSSIIGLLVIIGSVLILQIIGVNILRIPFLLEV